MLNLNYIPSCDEIARTYAADRVWENKKLQYSYFPGGYFDADGHLHYLHNDYQGSVVLVTDSAGQPRLYAGKERMAVTGEYDYGARQHFAPGLLWSVPDAMAEKYYPISPYVFCNGNPIANVDKDGNLTIFVNGFHLGDGGSSEYWCGVDETIMNYVNDHKAIYEDGSMGGIHGIDITYAPAEYVSSLNLTDRMDAGQQAGEKFAKEEYSKLDKDEKIRFVTHSMGSGFAKGYIKGMMSVLGEGIANQIEWEIDIAPYQPEEQSSITNINTGILQHKDDKIAGSGKMKGNNFQPRPKNLGTSWFFPRKAHGIESFKNEISDFLAKFIMFINDKNNK